MMDSIRGWLMALIAAATMCALADGLMPAGPVKGVGKVVCAMVLMCAILSPVARLDLTAGQVWVEEYFDVLEREREELSGQVDEQMKGVIEREYAAYIEDKAAQLGISCAVTAESQADGEGLWVPYRIRVTGPLSDAEQSRLSQLIQEDLGVPPERQSYIPEGVAP